MANHPAYGRSLFSIWKQGIKDRISGNKASANARWGFVRPPQGSGKVIWVRAGFTRSSVLSAVEVLAAIREKRQDVRLVMTFQEDYADILEQRLRGLQKTGIGFGPADIKPAMKRFFERVEPFAVICVEAPPGENLLQQAKANDSHVLCINTPKPGKVSEQLLSTIEAIYPASEADSEQWKQSNSSADIEGITDLQTLLVDPQVDPNFRSYISGDQDLQLAWLHHNNSSEWPAFIDAWQASDLSKKGVLFVSIDEMNTYAYQQNPANRDALMNTLKHKLEGRRVPYLFMEKWQRDKVAPGTIVVVDNHRWLPAISSSVEFSGVYSNEPRVFWQAMGAATPVGVPNSDVIPVNCEELTMLESDPDDFFTQWSHFADNNFDRRRVGDALRRLFWQYRRQTDQVKEKMLQRVFDW